VAVRYSTKHPYAAIEHRVLDSPAYADLTFSARALLVLITRQLSKDNNGHLQATYAYMRRFGIASEHTLSRAIQELIAHGMIYRARAGGYQQGAAQFAVTWLPIKKREGLFLDGFKACAWRDWEPEKRAPAKPQEVYSKKGISTRSATSKSAACPASKSADIELMPYMGQVFSYRDMERTARQRIARQAAQIIFRPREQKEVFRKAI
jgi:hypothetical protein